MSVRSYSLVEPHPSARPQTYLSTGRGGVGNQTLAPSNLTRGTDATGPAFSLHSHPSISTSTPTRKSSSSPSPRTFTTGRGGAGNARAFPEQRAIFSFDEELERELSRQNTRAPVYHVGRGGAGNFRRATDHEQRVLVEQGLGNRRVSQESAMSSGSSARSGGSATADSGADVATRKIREGLRRIIGGT